MKGYNIVVYSLIVLVGIAIGMMLFSDTRAEQCGLCSDEKQINY